MEPAAPLMEAVLPVLAFGAIQVSIGVRLIAVAAARAVQ